jgi:hypothetical protein
MVSGLQSLTGLSGTPFAPNLGEFSGLLGGSGGAAAGAADALTLTGSAINPTSYSMAPSALLGDSLATTGIGAGAAAPGAMTTYGMLDTSLALPGTEFTPFTGASGIGGIGDVVKAIGPSNLIKGGLTLAGGLLGSAGADEDKPSAGGSASAIAPSTIPKPYGGGGMLSNYGPMGPTETERRMRREYLPGLLGGKNPWGA